MNATTPVAINGQTYPVWQISLAISQALRADGSQPISFALRCVPSRVADDGEIVTLDSAAVTVVRGSDADIADPVEQAAFGAVKQAVVAFLVAKGL
jgi:hypothetical protein